MHLDLPAVAAEYGVKNLRFFIPMRPLEFINLIPGIAFKSSNSKEEIVECEVDERRYSVSENYKIELRALDRRFGYEQFYICDLSSNIRQAPDRFRVFVLTIDGYQQLSPRSESNPESFEDWEPTPLKVLKLLLTEA